MRVNESRSIVAKAFFLILFVMLIVIITPSKASALSGPEAKAIVKDQDGAMLRSKPTTESTRLAILKHGSVVAIKKVVFTDPVKTGAVYKWYYVNTGAGKGYIRSDLVKIKKYGSATGTVTEAVDYRKGAGESMKIKGTLEAGSVITVVLQAKSLETKSVWYKFRSGDKCYYVPSENVELTDIISGLPEDFVPDPDNIYQSGEALTVINGACSWARVIAADNRFHYGYGKAAHHNGCYFCNTNTKKGGRAKKGVKDYKFTYCCNPFVHAAFAHGGNEQTMLGICKKGKSYWVTDYPKTPLFANLGKPAMNKLRKGDVLCSSNHVMLYVGDGQVAEAAGGDDNKRYSKGWNNSIRVKKLGALRYKKYRVYRYIGNDGLQPAS